jgi:hypothetical protein
MDRTASAGEGQEPFERPSDRRSRVWGGCMTAAHLRGREPECEEATPLEAVTGRQQQTQVTLCVSYSAMGTCICTLLELRECSQQPVSHVWSATRDNMTWFMFPRSSRDSDRRVVVGTVFPTDVLEVLGSNLPLLPRGIGWHSIAMRSMLISCKYIPFHHSWIVLPCHAQLLSCWHDPSVYLKIPQSLCLARTPPPRSYRIPLQCRR